MHWAQLNSISFASSIFIKLIVKLYHLHFYDGNEFYMTRSPFLLNIHT